MLKVILFHVHQFTKIPLIVDQHDQTLGNWVIWDLQIRFYKPVC